jgi:glycosyltransferase involved in cell wall biosynthesis
MDRPFISIIIPVFNVELYLARCLDSIIGQAVAALEIVLVNDGSTDRSGRICDEYAARDSRIRVFHKKNGGVSSARNLGLELSTGDYVWFVDGDDYVKPCALEILKQWTTVHPDVDLFVFSAERRCVTDHAVEAASSGQEEIRLYDCTRKTDFRVLYEQYAVSAWRACYRGGFARQFRFEKLVLGEDILFSMEALYGAATIAVGTATLYVYCVREDSAVCQVSRNFYQDSLDCCCKIIALRSPRRSWIEDQLFRKYRNKVFGEALVFASRLPRPDQEWARALWFQKAGFFLSCFQQSGRVSGLFQVCRLHRSYWLARCLFEVPFRLKAVLNRSQSIACLWSRFRLAAAAGDSAK